MRPVFMKIILIMLIILILSIPVAVRSKEWVYGRSLTEIVGSNPAKSMDVCLL